MKKLTKILLIPLIIIIALVSLVGAASATYIPVVTPACVTYIPYVYDFIHGAVAGDEKAAVVISAAMAPTIEKGAVIYYRPVPYSTLKVNDLVVTEPPFNETGVHMIVRRITGISPSGLSTRGDGNGVADPWIITPNMVIGKITDIKNPSGKVNYNPDQNATQITNDNQPPSQITANYSGNGEFQISALLNGNSYSGNFTTKLDIAMQQVGTNAQFSVTFTPTSASASIAPLLSTDGSKSAYNFVGTVSGSQVIANAKGTINGASFEIYLNGTIDSNTFAFTISSSADAEVKVSSIQPITTQSNA